MLNWIKTSLRQRRKRCNLFGHVVLSCCSKRNVILLEFLIASKIQKIDNLNQSCSAQIESTLLQHTYSCSVKLVKKSKVVLRWVDPRVQSCRRQQHKLASSAPSPRCLIIVHQVHGAYPTSYKQEMNRNANKSLNYNTKWHMCIESNFCCFWTTPSRASKALKKSKGGPEFFRWESLCRRERRLGGRRQRCKKESTSSCSESVGPSERVKSSLVNLYLINTTMLESYP